MKEVEEKRLRETYWRFSNEKWVEVQMGLSHPMIYVDHVRVLGELAQLIVTVISLAFVM